MGADEQVLAVEPAIRHVAHEPCAEPVVVLLADLVVDVAPPDLRLAGRLADDELVFWGPAGVRPGADDEGPFGRDHAFPFAKGRFVERGGREVGDDLARANTAGAAGRAGTGRFGRGLGHGHCGVGLLLGLPGGLGTVPGTVLRSDRPRVTPSGGT